MRTKTIFLPGLFLALLLQGCIMYTQEVKSDYAEQYIKTKIESHTTGDYSHIKIYSIYGVQCANVNADICFTGYKYAGQKGLVIYVRPFTYVYTGKYSRKEYVDSAILFVELSVAECKLILDQYKVLQEKILKEQPINEENVYHDFTVSDDLFISYRAGNVKVYGQPRPGMPTTSQIKTSPQTIVIDFWIRAAKYSLKTVEVISQLEKFMNY